MRSHLFQQFLSPLLRKPGVEVSSGDGGSLANPKKNIRYTNLSGSILHGPTNMGSDHTEVVTYVNLKSWRLRYGMKE